MEKIVHIKTDFACVYLLNGSFVERADAFDYDNSNPLYITVLPLSAHLLPYTAKITNGKTIGNENLCTAFISENHMYIKLNPRYNYIYTTSSKNQNDNHSLAEKFFNSVKSGDIALARTYLSGELSQSIDDDSLVSFFGEYNAIIKNEFCSSPTQQNEYFLLQNNNNATLFIFDSSDGVIENITEKSI